MTDSATLETHALPIAQYLVAIVDAAPFLMFRIPCVGNPGNYRGRFVKVDGWPRQRCGCRSNW